MERGPESWFIFLLSLAKKTYLSVRFVATSRCQSSSCKWGGTRCAQPTVSSPSSLPRLLQEHGKSHPTLLVCKNTLSVDLNSYVKDWGWRPGFQTLWFFLFRLYLASTPNLLGMYKCIKADVFSLSSEFLVAELVSLRKHGRKIKLRSLEIEMRYLWCLNHSWMWLRSSRLHGATTLPGSYQPRWLQEIRKMPITSILTVDRSSWQKHWRSQWQ